MLVQEVLWLFVVWAMTYWFIQKLFGFLFASAFPPHLHRGKRLPKLPILLASCPFLPFPLLRVVTATWLLHRGVGLAMEAFKEVDKRRIVSPKRLPKGFISLLGKGLQGTIMVIGLLSILAILGFNPSALLASASVGSLGLALFAQDVARNIVSSIIIFFDKPFNQGDTIVVKGLVGKVESVELRATRLRTPQNSIVYIPNTLLSNCIIENRAQPSHPK